MGKSYKRHYIEATSIVKNSKRFANKRVRQLLKRNPEMVLNHNSFKKVYESCEIRDYIVRAKPFNKFFDDEVLRHKNNKLFHYRLPPNKEDLWNEYQKRYIRK